MKRNWITCGLIALSFNVQADTDLQFKGVLISDPCTVDTGSEEQIIEMGTIAAKTFINHQRSAPKDFRISLKDCDLSLGNTVSVTFEGKEDDEQPGTFAVTGDAAGIAIALEERDGKPIKPGNELKPAQLNQGETVLSYIAYVQGLDFSKVKEGAFESKAIFFLAYE
ncbi:fimbrial protein [Enterobacter asburiae]|uniref:fimbrial protein n=1 Tax=Enterobacter asburiae TaxID=61645 RepID=UPI000A26AC09|nr:fimbrial protein [Enterobacter asburiae]